MHRGLDDSKMISDKALLGNIGVALRKRAERHLTPILYLTTDNAAEMLGTGFYFNDGKANHLLTCEHVTREGASRQLLLLFEGQEQTVFGPRSDTSQLPEDLSLAAIEEEVWSLNVGGTSSGLTIDDISSAHCPVEGELLFFLGVPGYGSTHIAHWSMTFANAHPAILPEVPSLDCDPQFVFRLPYRPWEMEDVQGGRDEMPPDPHGFSGSLVWNTRYMEVTRQGGDWTPDAAQVTGMIQRWDSARAELMCCKCETIRAFIDYVLKTDPATIPLKR